MSVGARIFIEWPRSCSYWYDKRVSGFLKKYGFRFADFDGCMYGLIAAYGKERGMSINKPWRIACWGSCLPDYLCRKCDGSHAHTPCQGSNTLYTQGYTPQICNIIHQCIQRDIAKLGSKAFACAPTSTRYLRSFTHVCV